MHRGKINICAIPVGSVHTGVHLSVGSSGILGLGGTLWFHFQESLRKKLNTLEKNMVQR